MILSKAELDELERRAKYMLSIEGHRRPSNESTTWHNDLITLRLDCDELMIMCKLPRFSYRECVYSYCRKRRLEPLALAEARLALDELRRCMVLDDLAGV